MNTPGRFLTKNYDSPDTTIRWVLEYSELSDFSDLGELSLAGSSVFDKSQSLDVNGVDLDVKKEGGVIKSGRFVFTKKQPQDEFEFPRDGKLENGVIYYFKNYKVRQLNDTYWCVRPERSQHSLYPSEVETRPRFLGVEGFPSVVRFLRHESVKNDRISIAWDEPLDSGNNRMTYTAEAMNVSYGVTARPECGSDSTRYNRCGAGDVPFQTSTLNYPLTGLYQGQLYTLLVRSQNEMGSSQAVSLLGRPVSAPEAPRDVALLINPLNLTNGTGNRVGLVTWSPPLDTGLGVPCAAAWAAPRRHRPTTTPRWLRIARGVSWPARWRRRRRRRRGRPNRPRARPKCTAPAAAEQRAVGAPPPPPPPGPRALAPPKCCRPIRNTKGPSAADCNASRPIRRAAAGTRRRSRGGQSGSAA